MAQTLEIATENARQQGAKKIHQLKMRIGASRLFLSHWYSYLIDKTVMRSQANVARL